MNSFFYRLPTLIKINLGLFMSAFSIKKRKASSFVHQCHSNCFLELNKKSFKRNIKKFFLRSAWSDKEIIDFCNYLYTDKIELVHKESESADNPYIICVVKNERDKLINFFEHYNRIGRFNYIFIDNNSSDDSREIITQNHCTLYECGEIFSTNRKLAWINAVFSTIPNDEWVLLLDADELLVYNGYETIRIESIINALEKKNIKLAGAIMIDMFSDKPSTNANYISDYVYFENNFHVEKSIFFDSVYGGIREREFKSERSFSSGRSFLIKKHPVIKKDKETLLIHCHYIYPFLRNYKSRIYFGLLHYKLFDKEFEKYKKIAEDESYGGGSVEYKNYMDSFKIKKYEDIFSVGVNTVKYEGSASLNSINILNDILKNE